MKAKTRGNRHASAASTPTSRAPSPASSALLHCAARSVLCALRLAATCHLESARLSRDSGVAARLAYGAALLEHIASGVLQGAVRATIEKDERNRAFNPWRTGKDPVDPSIARDYFAQTCLHHAADFDLKVCEPSRE